MTERNEILFHLQICVFLPSRLELQKVRAAYFILSGASHCYQAENVPQPHHYRNWYRNATTRLAYIRLHIIHHYPSIIFSTLDEAPFENMRITISAIAALALPICSASLAKHVYIRDDTEAFNPEEDISTGTSCEAAFGEGYVACGAAGVMCYNPAYGETCCDGGCKFSSYIFRFLSKWKLTALLL